MLCGPTELNPTGICTAEVPQNAAAFQVAYCASQACRALTGAHQQIARRTAAIVGHHGSTEPFRPGCVHTHEALVLRGFVFGIPRPRLRGAHTRKWIEARHHDDDSDLDSTELRTIRVFVTRGRPGSIYVEPTTRLENIAEHAAALYPDDNKGRLRWPPFIPATPGAVPTALYVTPEAADEAPHWALADVRRVGHPPLLLFQTVPLPHVADIASTLSLLRHELPSLRPVSNVFLDDRAMTDVPQVTDAVSVLTLMGTSTDPGVASPEPALDANLDLMERRIALLAHFNAFPPAQWPSRRASEEGGTPSGSITEDHTDSSASFHSGSFHEDLDNDPVTQLPLSAFGATSTTTTAVESCQDHVSTTTNSTPALDFAEIDSPRPRQCNIISTVEDVATAHVCIFAACGHSTPTQVNTRTTISAAEVLSRCTSTFNNMGLLPDMAHWILSQRAHWLHDGRLAVFLTTGWGTLEPDFSSVWIEPGHRWSTPFTLSLPLVAHRGHLLSRLSLPHMELLVATVNGVIWDGTPRPFFNGDVIQLRSTWHRLGTLPVNVLDDRTHGIAAMQCGCDGPSGIRDASLTPLFRDTCLHQFFCQWEDAFLAAKFGPSTIFNNLYLIVHGGPFLRISLGTRLPPARADVQAFYDEVFCPTIGQRFVEDAHFAWDDTCVFVARTGFYPSSMWLLLGGPRLDYIELDASQNLSQLSAPPGRVWYPSETRGNIGIAFLQSLPIAGTLPQTHNLDGLDARSPDAAPEPGSPVTSGDPPSGSHTMHSIFGTSSEGFQDDFAGLASSSEPSGDTVSSETDPRLCVHWFFRYRQSHARRSILAPTLCQPMSIRGPSRNKGHTRSPHGP